MYRKSHSTTTVSRLSEKCIGCVRSLPWGHNTIAAATLLVACLAVQTALTTTLYGSVPLHKGLRFLHLFPAEDLCKVTRQFLVYCDLSSADLALIIVFWLLTSWGSVYSSRDPFLFYDILLFIPVSIISLSWSELWEIVHPYPLSNDIVTISIERAYRLSLKFSATQRCWWLISTLSDFWCDDMSSRKI